MSTFRKICYETQIKHSEIYSVHSWAESRKFKWLLKIKWKPVLVLVFQRYWSFVVQNNGKPQKALKNSNTVYNVTFNVIKSVTQKTLLFTIITFSVIHPVKAGNSFLYQRLFFFCVLPNQLKLIYYVWMEIFCLSVW